MCKCISKFCFLQIFRVQNLHFMRFSTSDNYFAPSPQNPQRETAPVCPPRHGLFLSHKDTAYPPVQHRLNPKVSVILPTTETFLNTFLYPYYKENYNATLTTQSAAFTIYMPPLGRGILIKAPSEKDSYTIRPLMS